jgi:hypothetical protein
MHDDTSIVMEGKANQLASPKAILSQFSLSTGLNVNFLNQ